MIKQLVPLCETALFHWEKREFARRPKRRLSHGVAKTGVVLSLTSIEPRLPSLHLVIHRVLRNGFTPDFIEVWLDKALEQKITPELRRLETEGVRLNLIEDLGPHTKLLYAIQRHPGAAIITIDDDVFLPRGSLEKLAEQAALYPGAVICNRAKVIVTDEAGNPAPYREWMVGGALSPRMDILPLGYGSVYYPPGSLDSRCLDIPLFQKLCPTGDDLWFAAMRVLNGVMAFHTGFFSGRELDVPGSGRYCIKKRHGGLRGNNDEFIRRLWEEFDLASRFGKPRHRK